MPRATQITGLTINATVYTVSFQFDTWQNIAAGGGSITFASAALALVAAQAIASQLNSSNAQAILDTGKFASDPVNAAGEQGEIWGFYVPYASGNPQQCQSTINADQEQSGVSAWTPQDQPFVDVARAVMYATFVATGSGPPVTVLDTTLQN